MGKRKKDASKSVLGSSQVKGQGTGYEAEFGAEHGATDSARKKKRPSRKG
ncbi:YuzL family protein [Lottiidibacillus patelloidae]|nr:YuzL family protein [Lottiidibacillus patelloidae]